MAAIEFAASKFKRGAGQPGQVPGKPNLPACLTQPIRQVVRYPAAKSWLCQVAIGLVRVTLLPVAVAGMSDYFERIMQIDVIDAAKLLVGRE